MSLEYRVIYADTDSIFAWVRGKSRDECTEAAMKLTRAADDSIKNIPFEDIRADIKGAYMTILTTAKNLWRRHGYVGLDWAARRDFSC